MGASMKMNYLATNNIVVMYCPESAMNNLIS